MKKMIDKGCQAVLIFIQIEGKSSLKTWSYSIPAGAKAVARQLEIIHKALFRPHPASHRLNQLIKTTDDLTQCGEKLLDLTRLSRKRGRGMFCNRAISPRDTKAISTTHNDLKQPHTAPDNLLKSTEKSMLSEPRGPYGLIQVCGFHRSLLSHTAINRTFLKPFFSVKACEIRTNTNRTFSKHSLSVKTCETPAITATRTVIVYNFFLRKFFKIIFKIFRDSCNFVTKFRPREIY